MICRACGYSLRGLDSPRCPECGRPFDRFDPSSFAFGELNGWVSSSVAAVAAILNVAVWGSLGLYSHELVRIGGWRVAPIFGAFFATMATLPVPLGIWLLWQLCQRRWLLRHRPSVLVALVIVLVMWLYNLRLLVNALWWRL